MVYVAATFVIVLAIVLGIHWVMVGRPEALERGTLHKRLRTSLGQKPAKRIDFVKQVERLSAVKGLDVVLAHTTGVASSLQRLIARADMQVTVGQLVMTSACFLGAWLLVAWSIRLPWLGLAVGALLAGLPFYVVKHKAARRLRKFEEQFPEAIDLISRALRAGHGFTTGLSLVAEEAPQPAAGEFRLVYDQQNFGLPLGDALTAFAERVQILDARFFVTAVLTQRESGGNLAEILGNLSAVIRERFKVKRQVQVVSAHGRITGWVLSGLPPSLAMAFLITSPNHIQTLFNDPMGLNLIYGALFLQVMGTLIIRRLVDIEY
jgi:tight adherence protein B